MALLLALWTSIIIVSDSTMKVRPCHSFLCVSSHTLDVVAVPIFDGRLSKHHQFLFRPKDFDNIATMPRVTKDLDRFALVAVSYTPGVWSPNGVPRINLNVQFVILLGQAPKPDELASAGYGVE